MPIGEEPEGSRVSLVHKCPLLPVSFRGASTVTFYPKRTMFGLDLVARVNHSQLNGRGFPEL